MNSNNIWTPEEIERLKASFSARSNEELATMFCRTKRAITTKASKLGLRKNVVVRPDLPYNLVGNIRINWTPSMIDCLKRNYEITKNEDLAVMLGVSMRSVTRKARELGLKKNVAWVRALWKTNVKLAHGFNKLCYNSGKFQKGHPPTATSFKPGHVPAGIQPVIRLDTMQVYESTKSAAMAVGCCQSNISTACGRKGRAMGVAFRYCRDMPCGSCRFLVGVDTEDIHEETICGCGLDSHITTTDTVGCKKYLPKQ